MKLTIARHGETAYNAEGRYQGSLDIPLNAQGLQQAAELAAFLQGRSFDIIIASPLLRARKTAEIVAEALQLPLEFDARLVEINMGVYEGLIRSEAAERYPEVWARDPINKYWDEAIPGGESVRQVEARAVAALRHMGEVHAGKSVLVIGHGFTSRVINRYLKGLPFEEMMSFRLDNCETVEYDLT
ncbi:MAG: histidine phosphatase family protein [Symbiobacteriaceae bacterium]|nr:histidine phosphatase family protein [Symbiobacteriaceae bacterium]